MPNPSYSRKAARAYQSASRQASRNASRQQSLELPANLKQQQHDASNPQHQQQQHGSRQASGALPADVTGRAVPPAAAGGHVSAHATSPEAAAAAQAAAAAAQVVPLEAREKLQLLSDVTGYAEPGVLMALMVRALGGLCVYDASCGPGVAAWRSSCSVRSLASAVGSAVPDSPAGPLHRNAVCAAAADVRLNPPPLARAAGRLGRGQDHAHGLPGGQVRVAGSFGCCATLAPRFSCCFSGPGWLTNLPLLAAPTLTLAACRKTVGDITGEIFVNGHPKEQRTWSRVVGYCEQVRRSECVCELRAR